jgi:peptidoglycan hydrolase-like protein with peptidoglycan-binding domain
MKRTILQLVVALCVVGSVRADQTIQSVQQALTDQGFYYGNATGEKSAETTAAIRRYQIRNGLQVNGEINSETLRSLNVSSNSASTPPITSTTRVTQPTASRPDYNSRPALDSSRRSFGESGRRVENQVFVGTPSGSTPPEMHVRMVAEVQRQLGSHGYYRGWIDGRYGDDTALAVRTFQSRSGISPTGQLDIRTLEALGLPAENLAYLESAPWRYESRVWVQKKFKHGKWKVKWRKHHWGDDGDAYADEDERGNGDGHGHGHGHGDDD